MARRALILPALVVALVASLLGGIASATTGPSVSYVGSASRPQHDGYWLTTATGKVSASGNSAYYGDMSSVPLNQPIVGIASTSDGLGYWLVASDGGIFSFGDAKFFGSTGSIHLNQPIVGMYATPTGKGYWMVASDGGIFAYGDALFFGSMGGKPLNKPITGMSSTISGQGYWLVASDGGVFSYGDASFFGSMGGKSLNEPIVAMLPSASGKGYLFIASDGGVFAFGDAKFNGSIAGSGKKVVAITPDATGGYSIVTSDGTVKEEVSPATTTSTTTAPTTTTTLRPTTTTTILSTGFVHPGIVNSQAQMNYVKAQIAANAEPQASAFTAAKASGAGNINDVAHAVSYVGCAPSTTIDEGCTGEMGDWQAAYTQALVWEYTGNTAARDKSLEILNAWGSTLQGYKYDSTYSNGPLQAAWAAEGFTKAAEIMRYSNSGWSDADIAKFENMLKTTNLPLIENGNTGSANENWNMSMAEGTMNIGMFTNDRTIFNKGLALWRAQVTSTIYLSSDGATPIIPPNTQIQPSWMLSYWHNSTTYVNGEEQETCRDMGHVALGMSATINAAETAGIQGIDLYGEQQTRIVAGMEFTATYLNNPSAAGWPCPNPMVLGDSAAKMTYQIGYAHYHNAVGLSLPQTKQWISGNRPSKAELQISFETLTHGRAL